MAKNHNSPISKEKTAIPTPPKSGTGTISRRASPRGHSGPVISSGVSITFQEQASSPSRSTAAIPITKMTKVPGTQKRKVAMGGLTADDVLCPICDDVCTCTEQPQQHTSGQISGWSSPIVIKDNQHVKMKKQQKQGHSKNKKNAMTKARRDKIDKKADTMAQYVLSEYYFSIPDDHFLCSDEESSYDEDQCEEYDDDEGYYTSDISELDEILFELSDSEDEEAAKKMKELFMSKVNSVIGGESWVGSGIEDEEQSESDEYFLFDPVDAASLVVNLPVPTPSPCEPYSINGEAHLSNLTPQVLAAISAAAKTLSAATEHYTVMPTLPFSRDIGKQVAFLFDDSQQEQAADVSIEDVMDTSQLHGSSPIPHPVIPKRWDRIPISSFRKRRLSAPKNVLLANAIKQPPPEPPQDSFAQLHITDDQDGDIQLLLTTSQQDRQSRASVDEEMITVSTFGAAGEQTQSDQEADYWVHGYDETEFYWLGEHFRNQA